MLLLLLLLGRRPSPLLLLLVGLLLLHLLLLMLLLHLLLALLVARCHRRLGSSTDQARARALRGLVHSDNVRSVPASSSGTYLHPSNGSARPACGIVRRIK